MARATLQHIGNGFVRLPDGRPVLAEYAVRLGYVVEGTSPAPTVQATPWTPLNAFVPPAGAISPAGAPVLSSLDARFGAIMALPEAEGRMQAARQLAVAGVDIETAGRMLAGLPEDGASAPAVAAPPQPVHPRAARLAEIAAAGRDVSQSRRGGRRA